MTDGKEKGGAATRADRPNGKICLEYDVAHHDVADGTAKQRWRLCAA